MLMERPQCKALEPLSVLLATIVLLFISSPSFSLLKALKITDFYFPNEKLAAVIVGCWYLSSGKFVSLVKERRLLFAIVGFIFLLLVRIYLYGFIPRDFNLPATMASIFLYVRFFKSRQGEFRYALGVTLACHILVALIQYYFVFFNDPEKAMLFHNHPIQDDYYFKWRVSGLFMESSQFASFIVLSFILLEKLRSSYWEVPLLLMSFVTFIANQAITAYAVFTIWLLIENKKTQKLFIFLILLLLFDFFVGEVTTVYLKHIARKIYLTFFGFSEVIGETRFLDAIAALKESFSDGKSLVFGVGNRTIVGVGDIISYNIYRYGFFGFFCILVFYSSIIKSFHKYFFLILPLFLTCAPLMHPVQIFYLIILSSGVGLSKVSVKERLLSSHE